ncbi:MAG: ligand-binding protein, RmlD family [Candidatus Pelagibacter sp. TMED202]|nr:MAG: ligand-binding protein, RmlD family [Candidatus Pelagibacter sp. TMED202]|tara:strand:+ start:929 stop:1624 length:696 start_codon:yes stop_codon:yes gene_type:complete
MKKILVTGGEGRFAKVLKNKKSKYKFIFRNKKQLNILSNVSIKNNIERYKPNYILHLAGLSRPMKIHEKNINKSIDLNIIGTANIVKACIKKNLKIIHFSTSYVYPGTKGKYSEEDPLLPWNNYGWSKLGGECAAQMYKNSLILRACMTEKPFVHKSAFANVRTNFIYHEDFIKVFIKVLEKKGVFNIGGKAQTVYKFAKFGNRNINKIFSKGELPLRMDMSLKKISKYMK